MSDHNLSTERHGRLGFHLLPLALALLLLVGMLATVHFYSGRAEISSPGDETEITVTINAEPESLDPSQAAYDGNAYVIANQIYETLVKLSPADSLPEPGLASSWSVSTDGLTWDFYLRPGLKFQDGSDLDAGAVVYNLERWWDPTHPYHTGDFSYFENIFNGYKGPDCLITAVSSIGDTQVQIQLAQPYSLLPSVLSMIPFGIASPAAIQAESLSTAPVGSGPYSFQTWQTGDHISLVQNQDYWGEGPYLQNLHFIFVEDPAARIVSLVAGEFQVAENMEGSDLDPVVSDPNFQVQWEPYNGVGYLGINQAIEPLDDLRVRLAIAHAINLTKLVDDYYWPGITQAGQFLPPGMWGRKAGLSGYGYDPALAASLLTQAGYTDAMTITLAYRDVYRAYLPEPAAMADQVAADLEAVGFNIEVVDETSDFIGKWHAGELELFFLGWYMDYPHPDDFFYFHFCGAGAGGLGPEDTQLCAWLESARQATEYADQLAYYQDASQRVYDNLPLLPLAHTRQALVAISALEGILPSPVSMTGYGGVHYSAADQELVAPETGGSLAYTDAQSSTTSVQIPAQAVSETIILRLAPVSAAAPPSGFSFANQTFEINASLNGIPQEDFTFQETVTVTIEYSDSDVVGVEEDSLLLYYWDGTAWVDAAMTCQPPSSYTRDMEANVFSTGICHLSRFALMGESQPRIYLPMLIQSP